MGVLKRYYCAQMSITRKLFASCAVLICISACGSGEKDTKAPAPLEINAMRASKADVPISMEFVGQTKGSVDAEIRARVEGVVTSIHFEEGKDVKENQLLYTIDAAPYQAAVAEAQGKLAEAETKLVKAESDLKRVRPLVQMKALSERDLDSAVAQQGAAKGSVDAAKAALDSANIQLGYCQIFSPVNGVIGMTKAKVGEFVGRAPNPIVLNTVSNLEPIHVQFSVNEKEYLYFARLKQKEISDGKEPVKRKLQMILADGSPHSDTGEVTSIGREIDPTTGSIAVEAAFPNPGRLIRPGQYAKVRAVAETMSGAITVPKRSLRELQGQFQVFVIKPDNTIEPRTVKLGTAVGDQQIIESGVSENEIVATDGLQRLRAGMAVNAKLEG